MSQDGRNAAVAASLFGSRDSSSAAAAAAFSSSSSLSSSSHDPHSYHARRRQRRDVGEDAEEGLRGESEDVGEAEREEREEGEAAGVAGEGDGEEPTSPQAPRTLEERREAINSLFGFRPWKGKITKRKLEERSAVVQMLYRSQVAVYAGKAPDRFFSVGNVIWAAFLGWWLALLHLLTAGLMALTIVGMPYARLCYRMATYIVWPFGVRLERDVEAAVREMPAPEGAEALLTETAPLNPSNPANFREERYPSLSIQSANPSSWRQTPVGTVLYFALAYPLLVAAHAFASAVCWLFILFIPMSKMHATVIKVMTLDPLNLVIARPGGAYSHESMTRQVEGCVYTAYNVYYYKYSVFGMNIILVNMLSFVLFALGCGYLTSEQWRERNAVLVFAVCLFSVIPLAYYIGKAVSSISAQTSFAIGAFLNATFGTLVELVLFIFMMKKGITSIVQKSVCGSLLGVILLLPGLAMVGGGLMKQEQRFNRRAAGASGVLLMLAVFGAFMPTFFYLIYGSYQLDCHDCTTSTDGHLQCHGCNYIERNMETDPVYKTEARPLMYFCAIALPLVYLVGLVFTLKTHKHLYKKTESEEGGNQEGEEAPEWSKLTSICILLAATGTYSLISETLTDAISPALADMGLSETFAAVTIIGITPNIAEMVNAVQFAMQDNITLALEIGNVAAIQVALVQWPLLVLIGYLFGGGDPSKGFVLIFQRHDIVVMVGSVIVINYVFIDGRSNYFGGAALLFAYLIIIGSYWYIPDTA